MMMALLCWEFVAALGAPQVLNNTSALPAKFQIMPQDESTSLGLEMGRLNPTKPVAFGDELNHPSELSSLSTLGGWVGVLTR